jgi:hypothetical protein
MTTSTAIVARAPDEDNRNIIHIVPDEANVFGIVATENESTDSSGAIHSKLELRFPVHHPKDLKWAAGQLLPCGTGMRYRMSSCPYFLARVKNVEAINNKITKQTVYDKKTKRDETVYCDNTTKSHIAFCNALATGAIKRTVEAIIMFPPKTSYNNLSFNDNVAASDLLTLEVKPFGCLMKTGKVEVVELGLSGATAEVDHVAPYGGVSFSMALDTQKRSKDTRLPKKELDLAKKLFDNMKVADDDSDEG